MNKRVEMNLKKLKNNPNMLVNLVLGLIVVVSLYYFLWIFIRPETSVPDRVIDHEAQAKALAAKTKQVDIEGEHFVYKTFPGFKKGNNWAQFRGAKQDNIVRTKTLNFNWKNKLPKNGLERLKNGI